MRALKNDLASVCMHGVELENGREKYPPYGLFSIVYIDVLGFSVASNVDF